MSTEDIQLNDDDFASMGEGLGEPLGQGAESAGVPQSGAPASPPPAQVAALPDPYAGAPKSWAKEYHEPYSKADAALRRYIHQREEEQLRGISQYKQTSEFGARLRERMKPYEGLLQQHNVDPVGAFDALMRVHVGLTMGDENAKREWANYLINNYGLAQYLGQDPAQAQAAGQLREQVSRLEQMIVEDKKAKISAEIETFASNPENKYFDELYDDIVKAVQKGIASNIAEAYEHAKWSNPQIRTKIIAEMQAPQGQKPTAPAAPPLRSSSEPVRPAASKGSIDDTLEEVFSRMAQ